MNLYKKYIKKDADTGSLNLEMSLIIGLVVLTVVASLAGVGAKISDLYEHQAVVIEEGPVGSAKFLITDIDGNPLPNINVTLNPIGQPVAYKNIAIAVASKIINGTTDDDGVVFFKYVPVGKATVTADGEEIIPTVTNVTILENKTIELPVEVRLAKFILQYDRNGGTGTLPLASEGKVFTIPNATSLSAPQFQEFAGWGTTPIGGIIFSPGETLNIPQTLGTDDEVVVLFAQWRDRSDVYQNFEATIVPGYAEGKHYGWWHYNTVYHWSGWYSKFDFRANSTTNPNQRYTFTYYNNVSHQYWDPQYEYEYRGTSSHQYINITGTNGFDRTVALSLSDFKQHTIKLEVINNNFKVYLDGVLKMNVTDTNASRPVKGYMRQVHPDSAIPSGFQVDSFSVVKLP